jgi:hypothetical protein
MSEQPPLALQWLVHIRDHEKLTTPELALAAVLVTYGEGKNIFASMVTLAEKTGMSRPTVIKARNGLLEKKLLADITGDPDKQSRTYRLNVPVKDAYTCEAPQGVKELDTQVSKSFTPPVKELDTPVKEIDTTSSSRIKQENQARTSSPAGPVSDDASGALGEDPGGETPQTPLEDDDVKDENGFLQEDRQYVAKVIGTREPGIGPGFWSWFGKEYAANGDDKAFFAAVELAGDIAAKGRNPAGLFRTAYVQQLARVREMMADGSWTDSDDGCMTWIRWRIFDDDFMPAAETFTVDDVIDQLGVKRILAGHALARLVRLGDLITEDKYTYRFKDEDQAA